MKHTTYWKVLTENIIEIPLYQRDYAQGRADEHVTYLRDGFAKSLVDALDSVGGETLDLNLVFGSIRDNQDHQTPRFIPVDGQQRLTTLHLLHWLVALRAGTTMANKRILDRFIYEIRVSSADFFQILAASSLIDYVSANPVKAIRDSVSFASAWERDPTVAGALTMLESLSEKLGAPDIEKDIRRWKTLTGDLCPIRFVHIKAAGLAEDLYVKMNARGKQLTDFENFKAWLGGLITKRKWKTGPDDWELLLDTDWLDIFWTHKDKDENDFEVDQEYMRFFNGMAQLSMAGLGALEDRELVESRISALLQAPGGRELHIPLGQYEVWGCFNEYSIGDAFSFLELMKEGHAKEWSVNFGGIGWFDIDSIEGQDESMFRSFIAPCASYRVRLRFYALCRFLQNHPLASKEEVTEWLRVMRNLIVNSDINARTLRQTVKAISDLAAQNIPILEYLCNAGIITGFSNEEQVQEERDKAKLILEDKAWRGAILEAENYSFFRGSVRVLLARKEGSSEMPPLELFRMRFDNARLIFSANSAQGDFAHERLLVRFVISQIKSWDNFERVFHSGTRTFDDKRDNWHSLFKDHDVRCFVADVLSVPEQEALTRMRAAIGKDSDITWDTSVHDFMAKATHEALYRTKLLCLTLEKSRIQWQNDHIWLHKPGAHSGWFLLDNSRNHILRLLDSTGLIEVDQDYRRQSGDEIFYFERNIPFFQKDNKFLFGLNKISIEKNGLWSEFFQLPEELNYGVWNDDALQSIAKDILDLLVTA